MMAGKGDEDMESLFEGMVLFNASQTQEDSPPENRQDDRTGDCLQYRQNDFAATSSSQPLDENLFSDLTLVTPLDNSEVAEAEILLHSQSRQSSAGANVSIVAATATATSTARQSSRRKKRAGLRIGYGRDNLLSNDLPHPPSPQPQHPLPITGCLSSETLNVFQTAEPSSVGDTFSLHPPTIITDAVVTTPAGESSSSLSDNSKSEIKDSWYRKDGEISQEGNIYNDSFSEAKFLQIKDRIYEKLNRARQLVASLSAVRKDSIRNRRKAVKNANLASLKHMELEKQLEEACEAEDFERAERVSQDLSDAEKEKQGFMNSLREVDALIDSVDFKMQQALDSQIAAEEECAILLEQFATNAANNADFTLKKAASMHSIEMDKWLSSSESLEVKKMELEIESQFLSGARVELNNNIEHLIQDDKREKEILCKRKDILMDELEKLLALVKQKEMEIADNDSIINAVENKISNVVSGFQEIRSSIDVKYDNLHSVLAQVNLEIETLSLKKQKIDDFLNQEEEKGAKLMELARNSEEEAKGFHKVVDLRKSLMSSTLKSREEKVTLANNEEKLSGDVKLFRQKVSAARASLQELSSRKSSIQQDIASFKQRIIFVDKRVPELEAEKKVATAARNFKEAARIAAEAKSLCVEKEGMQTNLGTAILNLDKLEEEIKDTLKQLQETEEIILLKKKELAMARFQRLLLTARTARAEKTAALEMGDVEEADLLLAEAEAADSEAEKLQSTYDFKAEDFTSLPNYVISIDLVSYLGRKQLSELAVTLHQSLADCSDYSGL